MPPSRFFDWTPGPYPAAVLDITQSADYEALRSYYSPYQSSPQLDRIFEIAEQHGVQSVVVEYRYIDLDYRDEHSNFYSTTFRRYPSVAHRLHFFTAPVAADWSNLHRLHDQYVGYSIMRPLEPSPVGRTMLKPPPELLGDDAVVALASDSAHLLGESFKVQAAPFISQDAQYLVCAHASEWMVLYHAHLCHGQPRRLPSDIHDASTGGVVVGRQLPSEGLSVHQMLAGLDRLGMPATRLRLPDSRAESLAAGHLSMFGTICRYINSGTPPIVVSDDHAWVVVGYRNMGVGPAHDNIVLYRNDDARGPYVRVDDPWHELSDSHSPWVSVLPPMPRKVYLAGERAEPLGRRWLQETAMYEGVASFVDAKADDRLTYLTYLLSSNEFKEGLIGRGLGQRVVDLYRYAQLPRYLWVIEALDRDRRDVREPCVMGEALIDATAHHYTQHPREALLAVHVGGRARLEIADFDVVVDVDWPDFDFYATGCTRMHF